MGIKTNGYNFTVTRAFFNKYIRPNENFLDIIVVPTIPDFFLTNVLDHQFNSQMDVANFIEAIRFIFKKNTISEENFNGLLYFIFYVNHYRIEFKQRDYFETTTISRARTFIDLLLLPIKKIQPTSKKHLHIDTRDIEKFYLQDLIEIGSNHKCSISDKEKLLFEVSKDVKFKIESTIKNESILINEGFNENLLLSVITMLYDNIRERDPALLDRIIKSSFDRDDLILLKKSLTDVTTGTNSLMAHLTTIMLPYLINECGLTNKRAKYISVEQSKFLFDFFAIVDILPKRPLYSKKLEMAPTVIDTKNPYLARVFAHRKSYAKYGKHIQETFNDKISVKQNVK